MLRTEEMRGAELEGSVHALEKQWPRGVFNGVGAASR